MLASSVSLAVACAPWLLPRGAASARRCAIPGRSGHDRPGAAARFTQEGASAHRQATVLDDAPPLRPKLSST
jgi:hypothetical protein